MTDFNFYSTKNPTIGENVLVQFTNKNDSFFEAKLIEYPYHGIMNFLDATKKKKIYSWNKLVPLNKDMVARVDDIDEKSNFVQLSIAYLDEKYSKDDDTEKIREKYMIPFNENKSMTGFIKSLCIIHNYDFHYIWKEFIHYIDILRRDYNDENNLNISLWKYFNDNIHDLNEWIDNTSLKSDPTIFEKINNLYNKRNEINSYKIISKIGIISLGGISYTQILFNNILTKINYNFNLKYDSTPYYIFETNSNDSSDDDHTLFINNLQHMVSTMEPKIFIKIDFIAKHVI